MAVMPSGRNARLNTVSLGFRLRACAEAIRTTKAYFPIAAAARTRMPKTYDELMQQLADLGIKASTIRHAPVFTVAEAQDLRGQVPGAHTKNLFLKDKKDNFFLVTVGEEAQVDLKTIHTKIGAASRVSFGKPEKLMEYLGLVPGSVSVLGVINDDAHQVKVVLDEHLLSNDIINAHPLSNDATTSIGRDDLLRFLAATGHEPLILKIDEFNPT
jgi:Ala-tRNA(Pro) deacylase